ncbi:MAG: hypothetical protein WBP12_04365 [Candidatus Saccharimonas sp.]
MSTNLRLLVAPKCSKVVASYLLVLGDSAGLWLTPELDQLRERSSLFYDEFFERVVMQSARPSVMMVEATDNVPQQVVRKVVFGVEDGSDPRCPFIAPYVQALDLANRQDDADAVVVPVYKGIDTEFEYRSRISQLAVALRAYLLKPEEERHIRRILLCTQTLSDYDQVALLLGDLVPGVRSRRANLTGGRCSSVAR